MARRKQVALDVPADEDEARALMAEYVQAEREALGLRLSAEVEIAAIELRRDTALSALIAANETRFHALKAWWEAGGNALGKGTRSAELAGAKIGIRLTPHKVKYAKGVKVDDVITWLKRLRWPRKKEFLRPKVELDKQAIIKAVQADAKVPAKFLPQLTVIQTDEFYIDAGLDEDAARKALAGVPAEAGAA